MVFCEERSRVKHFFPSCNEAIPPPGPDTYVSPTARKITVFYRIKKDREGRSRRGKK